MWCPSVSLSVWANAWLAGVAAPDDVLDALSQWAPRHSVTAYDSVAAGRTGLPWPDLNDAGAVSMLQTVRTAAGPAGSVPPIGVVLPVPAAEGAVLEPEGKRRILDAKLVGMHQESDLALLKVNAKDLPILPLGTGRRFYRASSIRRASCRARTAALSRHTSHRTLAVSTPSDNRGM